jgi:hypothetical protein
VDPDGVAERRKEPPREKLNPLVLIQRPGAWEESLKAILVLLDGARAPARSEFEQRGGAQGRTEAKVEEILEAAPARGALIILDLDIPHLGALLQIIRSHPYLFLLHDPLLTEVRLASVDEDQRIGLAVIAREIHLLKPGRAVAVVLTIPAAGAPRGGRLLPPQRGDVSLEGRHRAREPLDGLGQIAVHLGNLCVGWIRHG